jgi:hypothetical protein
MKFIVSLLLVAFVFFSHPSYGQSTKGNKKERKRIRKNWSKKNQSYNPYLDKKSKNKPSAKIARADRKELKKQKRRAKRQMRKSKRAIRH